MYRTELVELLISYGADIYKKNKDGEHLLTVRSLTIGMVDIAKENEKFIQIGKF